jgi:hypothetical protein
VKQNYRPDTRDFSDYPDPKLYDDGCRAARHEAFREIIPADARADYKRLYGVGREVILRVPAGTSRAQAKAQLGQWHSRSGKSRRRAPRATA